MRASKDVGDQTTVSRSSPLHHHHHVVPIGRHFATQTICAKNHGGAKCPSVVHCAILYFKGPCKHFGLEQYGGHDCFLLEIAVAIYIPFGPATLCITQYLNVQCVAEMTYTWVQTLHAH